MIKIKLHKNLKLKKGPPSCQDRPDLKPKLAPDAYIEAIKQLNVTPNLTKVLETPKPVSMLPSKA